MAMSMTSVGWSILLAVPVTGAAAVPTVPVAGAGATIAGGTVVVAGAAGCAGATAAIVGHTAVTVARAAIVGSAAVSLATIPGGTVITIVLSLGCGGCACNEGESKGESVHRCWNLGFCFNLDYLAPLKYFLA